MDLNLSGIGVVFCVLVGIAGWGVISFLAWVFESLSITWGG